MSDLLTEYLSQTRKEIDTEKHSRDNILNVVVLVLGAAGFAIFRANDPTGILRDPAMALMEIAMLGTITALFWLRRKKLQQIADRWFVLHNLLETHLTDIPARQSLEAIVEKDLQTTRYTRKDVSLCLGLSLPIYGLLAVTVHGQLSIRDTAIVVICTALVHIVISSVLMLRPFRCPEPLASERRREQPNRNTGVIGDNSPHVPHSG